MIQESAITTGKKLRQAREALKLSLEDVASELRLGLKIITALEKDDYRGIAGPAYARGYIRSYARLLGLSQPDVQELFHDLEISQQALGDKYCDAAGVSGSSLSDNSKIVRWIGYGLISALFLLVSFWSIEKHKAPKADSLDPATTLPQLNIDQADTAINSSSGR